MDVARSDLKFGSEYWVVSNELIRLKTRQVFKENMSGFWVLREISDEFDAARIDCDLSYRPPVNGQRRTLIEQYYHTVDWSDWDYVKRILQVFETVIHRAEQLAQPLDNQWQKERQAELEKLLGTWEKTGSSGSVDALLRKPDSPRWIVSRTKRSFLMPNI